MIDFSDGIRHLYMPGIHQISTDLKTGLNGWLSLGRDYIIPNNLVNHSFSVLTFEFVDFLRAYVYDINRLSSAALESINDISEDIVSPKFYGWIITKYYYSAFFSAHSILKLTGNSLSNIETSSINKVKELARSYGLSYGTLNSGLYCISCNANINQCDFVKDPKYDDSHKGIWLKFLHFLIHAQTSVYGSLPLSDAQLIADKLEELQDALTNYGCTGGHWLSRIRNSVNYSQSHGIWYPYSNYSRGSENILKYQVLCKENPLDIELASFRGKELLYFVRACQLINSINFNIQKDLVKRHSENKSFLLRGIFEYHSKYLKRSIHNNGLI